MTKMDFIDLLKNQLNIVLTKEQEAAALIAEGPAALIAVPGAGKTTVIESRIANLILTHDVSPESILTLTYSKASAMDMQQRFNKRFGSLINQQVYFATIHSFAMTEVIKTYEEIEDIKYAVIEGKNGNEYSKFNILKQLYKKHANKYMTSKEYKGLCNFISFKKNSMSTSKKPHIDVPGYYNAIYNDYEFVKKNQNLIDYDDMLTLCYYILINNPKILGMIRERHKYIQIDECQDMSWIQHQIIKLIAAPLNNVLYVGDEDQAIYGFRGASPAILRGFKKEYKGAKILFMQENFRSTACIVETANKFIKSNKDRFSRKKMTANTLQGKEVKIISCDNELQQARFVIDELDECKLGSTAVLYRNNSTSILLINELIKENIPFSIKNYEDHFFNHWVTKDIIAFLQLANNLDDVDALESVYYKFESYISKDEIEYLKSLKLNNNVFQRLQQSPNATSSEKERLKDLEQLFMNIGQKKPYAAIESIWAYSGYKQYLKNKAYSENLTDIISTLRIIAIGVNTLNEYKDKLRIIYETIKAAGSKDDNTITLSTIHSAKGLEFDTVFIIDMLEGTIPSFDKGVRATKSNELIEEERRLAYVGITRTKNNLYLLHPKCKNKKAVRASRFIKEIKRIKESNVANLNKTPNQSNQTGIEKIIEIKNGQLINHKILGPARVINIEEGRMKVQLKEGDIKILSLSACIENNLIETA